MHDLIRPFPDGQSRMRHDGLDLLPYGVTVALLHRYDDPAEHSSGGRPVQVGPLAAPHEIHPRPGHLFKLGVVLRQFIAADGKKRLAVFD